MLLSDASTVQRARCPRGFLRAAMHALPRAACQTTAKWRYGCVLALVLAGGCAKVPPNRYGITRVTFEGVNHFNPRALERCLVTHARDRVELTLGVRDIGECDEPPFTPRPPHFRLWSWAWTNWPTFDPIALELDAERVKRWYAARGYYDAEVTEIRSVPEQALTLPVPALLSAEHELARSASAEDASAAEGQGSGPQDANATHTAPDQALSNASVGAADDEGTGAEASSEQACERAGKGQGCLMSLTLRVEEGAPTHVTHIDIEGIEGLDPALQTALRGALPFAEGDRFDEAVFDSGENDLKEQLEMASYALATVDGVARVDTAARTAHVVYAIAPGPECVFGKVTVEGNGDRPEAPIRKAALLKEGQPYDVRELRDARRAAMSLGGLATVDAVPVRPKEGNVIDVILRVTPARTQAFALGVGLQGGELQTLNQAISVPQWDVHLLGRYRHNNLAGGMRQLTITERPRLIFLEPFPRLTEPRLGNQIIAELRQPGFLEPRVMQISSLQHDYGPDPFDVFFRSKLDSDLAVERAFWGGKLYVRMGLRTSWYSVPPGELTFAGLDPPSSTFVTFHEQVLRLDFRDAPVRTHKGAMFMLRMHEAGFGLPSDWDYIRFMPEVRGYAPLPWDMTLAARFRVGMLFVLSAKNRLDQASQELGPVDMRFRGGGASSNRGFLPGRIGDGLGGGSRQWEANLEWRIPVTKNLTLATFWDMGDVSRATRFRWDHPQAATGFGLRYYTIVGPIRADFAWTVPGLQVLANEDSRLSDTDANGDPLPRGGPFVFHITIGDPF